MRNRIYLKIDGRWLNCSLDKCKASATWFTGTKRDRHQLSYDEVEQLYESLKTELFEGFKFELVFESL